MLPTVATQAPRNSREGAGGAALEGMYIAANEREVSKGRRVARAMTNDPALRERMTNEFQIPNKTTEGTERVSHLVLFGVHPLGCSKVTWQSERFRHPKG